MVREIGMGWCILLVAILACSSARAASTIEELPPYSSAPAKGDWLITRDGMGAAVYRGPGDRQITLSNGLVSRSFQIAPNAATVALDHLGTGTSLLRGVKPEAVLVIDGQKYDVGGLLGQPNYAYLRREWLEKMAADPKAMPFTSFEVLKTAPRMDWKRARHAPDAPWPPPGAGLVLHFAPPQGVLEGLTVAVHYELYDGLPVFAKWLEIRNGTGKAVRLNSFIAEVLAAVEGESSVEATEPWVYPNIHVESDYAFHGGDPKSANRVVSWVPDPQYTSQVNYLLKTPALLECRPPIGPDATIEPGQSFQTFRVFVLLHDSSERERKGLAVRRMYRALAPWAMESPIMLHARDARPEAVRLAIDQCADVGFEMVILSFGSGFNMENLSPNYVEQMKSLADYARSKGVELGGYSLLASRSISPEHDVINPKTGRPGDAIFGSSPCLESTWGHEYFRKIRTFLEQTGMMLLEHDGSYPGDVCASTSHAGHRGLEDSQWTQWKRITEFYRWCRGSGIYLNVPDWYLLAGSNKVAMGYRETNWSLPRAEQIVLARQNMFDGTWEKTPSMGWMFVPLVEYHGGGAAATLEPLSQHLADYEAHLANCFGFGVQACYRGPRLYDAPETRAVVKKWVDFFKAHRDILESDIIHVRRADGRDFDAILHVNPQLKRKGLAMVFNPLQEPVRRTVRLPLYYTGLTENARISRDGAPAVEYRLDRGYNVDVDLELPAAGRTWLVIE